MAQVNNTWVKPLDINFDTSKNLLKREATSKHLLGIVEKVGTTALALITFAGEVILNALRLTYNAVIFVPNKAHSIFCSKNQCADEKPIPHIPSKWEKVCNLTASMWAKVPSCPWNPANSLSWGSKAKSV